ncbi:MAG: hypothetical protein ACXW2P_13740, partial [Thermoanaerobaculia bacterium]
MMKWLLLVALSAAACGRPDPLTAEKAASILRVSELRPEPVYAEVPQRVWWNAKAPKDDYDGKALKTLRNLETAGLVKVTGGENPDGSAEYIAKVTEKGFRIIGTAPSHRGAAFRGQIAFKVYDGLRNFQRHPNEPTTGSADLMWHYDNPTPLYPLFETKINKPLKEPFISQVSFFYKDNIWRFDVTVPKLEGGTMKDE